MANEKILGVIRKPDGIWYTCTDERQMLLADVEFSIVGEGITEVLKNSRSLLPLPAEYEALGELLPELSMLGQINDGKLVEMPVPCADGLGCFSDEDSGDHEDEDCDDIPPLVRLMENAGGILLNQYFTGHDLSYSGRRRRRRRYSGCRGYSIAELAVQFPRRFGYTVESVEDTELDMPRALQTESAYRYALLGVNIAMLERRRKAESSPPKRPRKPRPKALPVGLTVSMVSGWLYSLRNNTGNCCLKDLQSWQTRDLDRTWTSIQKLVPVIEQLYGKYAYRRLQEYRKDYFELMFPVMKNPVGCIRKMYNINEEFACWLELETQSKEAKQIQRGTFVVSNQKYKKTRPWTCGKLPEIYNGRSDYRRNTPLCLLPKPKPVKVKNENKAAKADAKKTTELPDEDAEAAASESREGVLA